MILYPILNNKNTIYSEYYNESMISLHESTFRIPENFSFNVFDVTAEYIARPDLISLDAYGDTMHTDIICKLNGISNPFELNMNTKIVLPTPDAIMNFYTDPKKTEAHDDLISSQSSAAPQAKAVHEKRGPNEAIIGNSRFKIDKKNGIVIY